MEQSIFEQLDPQERDMFACLDSKLDRLYRGGALDDWLAFCEPLDRIRQITLRQARANNTREYSYKAKLPHVLRRLMPHFLDGDYVRDEFSNLLYLYEPENQMRLAAYRASLTPAKHLALATPKAARNAVRRIVRAEEAAAAARALHLKQAADLPEPKGMEEPTITDRQFLAAFDRRKLTQLMNMLVNHDLDRARDLANAIKEEISHRRRDAKEAALKAARIAVE
jgi:hypothetical protein